MQHIKIMVYNFLTAYKKTFKQIDGDQLKIKYLHKNCMSFTKTNNQSINIIGTNKNADFSSVTQFSTFLMFGKLEQFGSLHFPFKKYWHINNLKHIPCNYFLMAYISLTDYSLLYYFVSSKSLKVDVLKYNLTQPQHSKWI